METKEIMEKLNRYVPIVDRVHGDHHPEFHQVRSIFGQIEIKLKKDVNVNLNNEFMTLRNLTNNYTLPDDVCETYEAVYNMLNLLDKKLVE